eukprot:TRINITY_DN59083_c0_g1_i1.p4 TRINITY_DN59083_c0_g1~~TRINITY_DN59083_c0_g1_i1.p4  ORF type:complete len:115 (-),score=28.64 TRINITY_DN59083_c0_g1_i1:162-506(-)
MVLARIAALMLCFVASFNVGAASEENAAKASSLRGAEGAAGRAEEPPSIMQEEESAATAAATASVSSAVSEAGGAPVPSAALTPAVVGFNGSAPTLGETAGLAGQPWDHIEGYW